MVNSLEEKEKVSTFVAGQILNLMTDKSGKLLDSLESNAVVLFSDIRSFTTLSEIYDPQEIVEMRNEYFELWQKIIQRHNGVIERFIGDAVVAVFFERTSSHYYQAAIQAAIDMSVAMQEFNKSREADGKFTVENGVGLAHGMVRFTIIGNSVKRHLSTLSPTSLKAEELTRKTTHSNILTDSELFEKCQHSFDFVPYMAKDENHYEVLID